MYVIYQDLKADPAARIAAALAAFRAHHGEPRLVLVAEGERADVAGVEVREAKPGELVVRPGIVMVAL